MKLLALSKIICVSMLSELSKYRVKYCEDEAIGAVEFVIDIGSS